VREGHIYVADGNALLQPAGPRIVESLEILAACLHPEAFADLRHRHRDSAIRLDADLKPHAL
jgi:iron complex transport system substrate-binding protein